MRRLRLATIVSVLALTSPLAARAADVSGRWTTEFDTQVGLQKYTFDLKVEAGQLTGTAAFERMDGKGTVELKEGKVEGDRVSFVEMLEFQGNSIRVEYTGQLAGDEIKFSRRVADFATEEFVAKRVK